jgi:hypothetical protein
MGTRTLVSHQRYFGMHPVALRHAAERVLLRIRGLPVERAHVSAQRLREDFGVDTIVGDRLLRRFVNHGLLEPSGEREGEYRPTERFAEFASARIVAPLPRPRAKELLEQVSRLAMEINRGWTRNPLAIDAIAVSGDYMSRNAEIGELTLWVIVGPRGRLRAPRWVRLPTKAEGAEAIRTTLRKLSSFMTIHLVTDTATLPRPFSVSFRAETL